MDSGKHSTSVKMCTVSLECSFKLLESHDKKSETLCYLIVISFIMWVTLTSKVDTLTLGKCLHM